MVFARLGYGCHYSLCHGKGLFFPRENALLRESLEPCIHTYIHTYIHTKYYIKRKNKNRLVDAVCSDEQALARSMRSSFLASWSSILSWSSHAGWR
jgi:hypothetical protein